MENRAEIQGIIEDAFNSLTIHSSIFIDINGYKTTELIIPELLKNGIPSIGVGFNKNDGAMIICKINNNFDSNDHRKFERIFDIIFLGYSPESPHIYLHIGYIGKLYSWHTKSFEFSKIGDFKVIAAKMQSVWYVMKEIERAESDFFKKRVKNH